MSFEQPVALADVARPAGGDDVVPRVRAALAARAYVVDRVGVGAAVLAPVAVAGHHGPPADGDPAPERHVHELAQPHDRRHRHLDRSACSTSPVGWTQSALPAEHQHDRPPGRRPSPTVRSEALSTSARAIGAADVSGGAAPSARPVAAVRRARPREPDDDVGGIGSGRAASPYWVSSRNRSHARSGTGRNGAAPPPPVGASRRACRAAVGHSAGRRTTPPTRGEPSRAHGAARPPARSRCLGGARRGRRTRRRRRRGTPAARGLGRRSACHATWMRRGAGAGSSGDERDGGSSASTVSSGTRA